MLTTSALLLYLSVGDSKSWQTNKCESRLRLFTFSVLLGRAVHRLTTRSTTMATSSSKQNSRFSTLKVFGFAGAQKPPPPPPKDPYYLANPSLASLAQSLSPEAFSPPFATRPTTPLSAGYASSARSPSPTPSYTPSYTPSFAASRTTLAPTADIVSPDSSSSRKGFFKFASLIKRPKNRTGARGENPATVYGYTD